MAASSEVSFVALVDAAGGGYIDTALRWSEQPLPWCGRCRAGYCNTGGPPLALKKDTMVKKRSEVNQVR